MIAQNDDSGFIADFSVENRIIAVPPAVVVNQARSVWLIVYTPA